jgi:hypothetical protein
MAIVTRRYALVGPGLVELQELVSPTISIDASYERAVVDISLDDSVPGIVETLDEQMASCGYAITVASKPAMAVPDLTGDPDVLPTGLGIYASLRAGRRLLSQVDVDDPGMSFQPALFQKKVALWTAQGNGTSVSLLGFGNTTTGTTATRNVSTAGLASSMRAIALQTGSTTTTSASTRHNALQFWRGNAPGLGGFFYSARFFVDIAGASYRWFIGLLGSSAVIGSTVDPSSLTDMIGFAIDAGEANVKWMHNDAAGIATKVDLGAAFPAATVGAAYEARIFCAPNGAAIHYSLERLDVSQLVEGSVGIDIPASNKLLSPQVWVNNGAAGGVVALGLSTQYIETAY